MMGRVSILIYASTSRETSFPVRVFFPHTLRITSGRLDPIERRLILVEHHKLSRAPLPAGVDERVGGPLQSTEVASPGSDETK